MVRNLLGNRRSSKCGPMARRRSPQVRSFTAQLEILEDRTLLTAAPLGQEFYLPPQHHAFNYDGYLTGPSTQSPVTIAETYLRSHAADFGLLPSARDRYLIATNYMTQPTGATTLTFEQTFNGLPVEYADFDITVAANGQLLSVGGGFVPGLGQKAGQAAAVPALDATDSVAWAANGL